MGQRVRERVREDARGGEREGERAGARERVRERERERGREREGERTGVKEGEREDIARVPTQVVAFAVCGGGYKHSIQPRSVDITFEQGLLSPMARGRSTSSSR